MPLATRLFIRFAVGYLLIGLVAGTALAFDPTLRTFWPTYLHLITVGWLTQLIFGVAFWLFPRASREYKRGREGYIWASLVLLNAGLVLRAAAEPFDLGVADQSALVLSALFQLGAAGCFVANMWPRLKARP
jgi:hypothetical protein